MECGKRCLPPLKFGTATNKMGRLHEEHAWIDHSEIQSIRTENAENCTTTKKNGQKYEAVFVAELKGMC